MRPHDDIDPSDIYDIPGDPHREAIDEAEVRGEFDDVISGADDSEEFDLAPLVDVGLPNEPTPDDEWAEWIEAVLDQDAPAVA